MPMLKKQFCYGNVPISKTVIFAVKTAKEQKAETMKRIKKIISIVLSFVLVMTCFPTYVFAADHQQDGVNALLTDNTEWNGTTISQPTTRETIDGVEYYKIYIAEELAYIAQTGGDWLTYNYVLANDIVLNDVELTYDASGNLTVDGSRQDLCAKLFAGSG